MHNHCLGHIFCFQIIDTPSAATQILWTSNNITTYYLEAVTLSIDVVLTLCLCSKVNIEKVIANCTLLYVLRGSKINHSIINKMIFNWLPKFLLISMKVHYARLRSVNLKIIANYTTALVPNKLQGSTDAIMTHMCRKMWPKLSVDHDAITRTIT